MERSFYVVANMKVKDYTAETNEDVSAELIRIARLLMEDKAHVLSVKHGAGPRGVESIKIAWNEHDPESCVRCSR